MNRAGQWITLQHANLPEALRQTEGPLPSNIRLRAVDRARDLPQIAALYNLTLPHDEGEFITPEQLADLVWHPGLSPKVVFLALDGDLLVGVGVGSVQVPGQGSSAGQGAVELLAVRPAYQQQGIGRALLHAVLGWLADRSVTVVGACTEHRKAARILQHYGFARLPCEGKRV